MEFAKYQHLERFGTTEVQGIEFGKCFIFPKIDGTNSQLWFDRSLQAGSRNRQLSIDNDNAGFYKWALQQQNIVDFFSEHPDIRLYGEWLVPHTLKTYADSAWRKFYVFDVMIDDSYLTFEEYQPLLEKFNIEYIPPICVIENPSYERLIGLIDRNNYLIKDGEGNGEGIVIKNYNFKNKYGRIVWAKIVTNEFKGKHAKVNIAELTEKKLIEQDIVDKYITKSLIEKEVAKIELECNGWSSKYIARLLNTIYHCLVNEECWNFVKEFKNPVIDFKRLQYLSTQRIKEVSPNLF